MANRVPRVLRLTLLVVGLLAVVACLGGRGGRGRGRNGGDNGAGGGDGGTATDGGGGGGGGRSIDSLDEVYGGDGCGVAKKTGRVTWRVRFGGDTWEVPMWIPEGKGSRNAVFLLHGYNGDGEVFARASGYVDLATRERAILVAPGAVAMSDGRQTDTLWQNGRFPDGDGRDDVKFLDHMANELRRGACVKSVLGTGFSDGAGMVETWACKSDRNPDAVVASAGCLMIPPEQCTQKVRPFRLYVGVRDERFEGPEPYTKSPTASETAAIFAGFNHCGKGTKSVKQTEDCTCEVYSGCEAATEYCPIKGLSHRWPDDPQSEVQAADDGYAWFLRQVGR